MAEAPQRCGDTRLCGMGQCALPGRCEGKPGLCLGWDEGVKIHDATSPCITSNQIDLGEGKVILQCMQQAW